MPNLESPQCAAARDTVKKFYSIHFASQLPASKDELGDNRDFLTERLLSERDLNTEGEVEYFTKSTAFPTAFRIGSCEAASDAEALVEIVLLWRSDEKSDQAEVRATVLKQDAKWLIDEVAE